MAAWDEPAELRHAMRKLGMVAAHVDDDADGASVGAGVVREVDRIDLGNLQPGCAKHLQKVGRQS